LRTGMRPGDFLYATAPLGLGNAYAFYKLFDPTISVDYRPMARLKESKTIGQFASACMDSSDGLFPSLSVLSALNGCGFKLMTPLQSILSRGVLPTQQHAGLPVWMFLAGPHGEYELLFTVPERTNKKFRQACEDENWQPVFLGEVISENKLTFFSESLDIHCHPAAIGNLFYESGGNVQAYFERLMLQHKTWSNT